MLEVMGKCRVLSERLVQLLSKTHKCVELSEGGTDEEGDYWWIFETSSVHITLNLIGGRVGMVGRGSVDFEIDLCEYSRFARQLERVGFYYDSVLWDFMNIARISEEVQ